MRTKNTLTLTALALTTLALAACGNGAGTSPTATATSAPASAAQEAPVSSADIVTRGIFEGRSDHVTTGQATIVKTSTGYELVFASDFSLDGAPDPKVGFGNNGAYDTASQVGALQNKDGAQTYTLPASFDPTGYNEVYIWCEKFSVPLGVATLAGDI